MLVSPPLSQDVMYLGGILEVFCNYIMLTRKAGILWKQLKKIFFFV
jgi:hypothetical protein